MAKTLTLRELRQNPTWAMDALEGGESVVITRHNRPIADLVPHARSGGATLAEYVELIGDIDRDSEWLRELTESRAAESRDLWGDGE